MNTVCIKLFVNAASSDLPQFMPLHAISYHSQQSLHSKQSFTYTTVCVVCKLLGLCMGWIDQYVQVKVGSQL